MLGRSELHTYFTSHTISEWQFAIAGSADKTLLTFDVTLAYLFQVLFVGGSVGAASRQPLSFFDLLT